MVELWVVLGEFARRRVLRVPARGEGSGAVLSVLSVAVFYEPESASAPLADGSVLLTLLSHCRLLRSSCGLPSFWGGANPLELRRCPSVGRNSVESTNTDAVINEELTSMLGKQIIGSSQSSSRETASPVAPPEVSQKGGEKERKSLDLQDPRTFRRLQQMVRKVCPTWLEREKDDLGQKAMIRLLELEQRFGAENREICASYLYRTVLSTVIDEIRKRKREVLANDVEDYRVDAAGHARNEELQSSTSPLGKVRASKLRAAILDCLGRLNEQRRRATSLRLQGFSNLEISKLLDWKPKKAENMALRGRLDLRNCLSKKGYQIEC